MVRRRSLIVSFLVAVMPGVVACGPIQGAAGDPRTTGDSPSVSLATTGRVKGVPDCPGGNRAKACLLGTNCRITEKGCQVCQCLEM